MATNFKGYLLKATKNNQIFPLHYLDVGGYETSPNIREEIKAYRDDNTRDLTRVTAQGMKTAIGFNTRKNLHLEDIMVIEKFFKDNETDHKQRKLQLEYWDNENFVYKTGTFYRANMKYKILLIDGNDIIYDAVSVSLVEY